MYYPFDVVPHFWNKLVELSDRNLIFSIDKVKKEICDTSEPDILSLWCLNDVNVDFFLDSSSCVDVYAKITYWIYSNQHYTSIARDDFLATDLADPWLIAYAKKFNFILVSQETSEPLRRNKVKMPDVCTHFGVKCITMMQMFRELGETF
jgi:hypothetical protein